MKRRSFISKTSLGISGMAAISTPVAFLASACSTKNKKLELAIVGCSGKGLNLVTGAIQKFENVTIKTLFDFDREKCLEAGETFNRSLGYIPVKTQDMESIFRDKATDGIFIFLPEHWRALATIQACRAGKDVYVDPLPAHSISEGKLMAETARKTKRIIQCGYLHRSAPSALAAREYIETGNLGQVVHVKVYNLQNSVQQLEHPEKSIPEGFDWNNWLGPLNDRPYSPEIYSRLDTGGWKTFNDFTAGRMSEAGNGLDLARMIIGNDNHPSSVFGYESNSTNNNPNRIPERQIVTWNFEDYTMACESGNAYGYMKNNIVLPAGEENIQNWLLTGNRVEVYGTNGLMYLDTESGRWLVQGEDGKIMETMEGIAAETGHVENFIECMRSRELPAGNIGQGHLSATLAHMGNIACRSGNKHLEFDKVNETFINNDKANALLKPAYRKEFEIV